MVLGLAGVSGQTCVPSGSRGTVGDLDTDGISNGVDNCIEQANADQADFDGDGAGDACDNCPATANSSQLDANEDDVGDDCEGFAFADQGGVVQMKVDARLRPTELFVAGDVITVDWTDDSQAATFMLQDEISGTVVVPLDFSDEGIQEALDEAEASTGQDMSSLREYVADNPGLIQRIVRGEEPAPSAAGDSSAAKVNSRLQELIDPQVARHLAELAAAASITRSVAWRLAMQHNLSVDPQERAVLRTLMDGFVLLANQLRDLRTEQERECIVCEPGNQCEVGCTSPVPFGACCIYSGAIASCYDGIDQKACIDQNGQFHEGTTCDTFECETTPGACCTTIDCVDTIEAACVALGGKFTADTNCGEIQCPDGACYTFHPTSIGDACCDCRQATDEECRADPDFYFFVRAEQCPGACYVGSGFDAYCEEISETECAPLGGTFFHDSVCAGVCLYDDGCGQMDRWECDDLSGHLHYETDTCSGACYYEDPNTFQDRCEQMPDEESCDARYGLFYFGEPCD